MINRRNRIAIFIIGLILLILLVVYFAVPRSTIKVTIAPDQVNVLIDNKKNKTIKNGTSFKVSPGTHTFKVTRKGFESYSTKLSIKNHDTSELLVALTPLTDAARKLVSDDTSQSIIQRFNGKIQTIQTNVINTNYPILKSLPIVERLYRIDACPSKKYPNDHTKIALCVTETDDSLNSYALAAITSAGFNPADFEIIFLPQGIDDSQTDL